MGAITSYMRQHNKSVTLAIFDFFPRKYWWALIKKHAAKSVKLANQGDVDALLKPDTNGWVPYGGIEADLWAFLLQF